MNDEKRLEARMKELGVWSNINYNLTHYERDGKHLVTAAQHWTWEFCIGEGNTLDEALINLKPVVNMYNHSEFKKIKEKYNIDM
jgi:hypothetical protein